MNIVIRDARPDETALLSRIAVESGTYTGQRDLRMNPDRDLAAPTALATRIATVDGQVCGFAELAGGGQEVADLTLLFVHQDRRGQGVGRALVEDVQRVAGGLGTTTTRIVAHPPTEGFFRRLGAQRTATRPPTDDVRWFCPVLELTGPTGTPQANRRAPALVG